MDMEGYGLDKQQPRARMDAIIEMTRKMLVAGKTGEWDRFHELEPRRRKEIRALFATPLMNDDAEYVAPVISEVIRLDEEIISLCEAEKKSCLDQLTEIRQGRRAHHAYQDQQQAQRFF